MKRRFFLIFALLTAAFSVQGQIRVDMNPGGAQLRPMNLSDYDRHEETFALTHADSMDYQNHVVRAYNYLATDSLPQARMHLQQALKISNRARGFFSTLSAASTWRKETILLPSANSILYSKRFPRSRTCGSIALQHVSNSGTPAKLLRT